MYGNQGGNDYSKYQIKPKTEIKVTKNWNFYWKQLLKPSEIHDSLPTTKVDLGSWTHYKLTNKKYPTSFGFATYSTTFSLPKIKPAMSLYIPRVFAASKIWINGELIKEIGKVGRSKKETLHRRNSLIIPLKSEDTDFSVVIQVSNFYHSKGGIDQPVILAPTERLQYLRAERIIADTIFISCLGFIGFFFLLFYVFYWNKDKAVIYFAILCIFLAYMALSDRYAPLAKLYSDISWIFLTKIEYVTLFIASTSASLFFNEIFKKFVNRYYSLLSLLCFILLTTLVIILPAPYFTKCIPPFLILMVFNLLYVTFVIVRAIIGRQYESILLLLSMLLGSFIFYIHIFFFLGKNGDAIIFVNFGYIIVFLLLAMLLMTRFSRSFKALEIAKEFALEQKAEIIKKSNELSLVNFELKENVKQLQNYNAELDNFNHIVSHDLKTPLVAIHTLVSFLEEDLNDNLTKNVAYHFNLLKERVNKMDALINGLLQYSKIAKGNKTKELFNLNDVLNGIVDIINQENKHQISLPENDLQIFANQLELEHVFLNLISNSIKYNDKKKVIITISAVKNSNDYLFSVKDNGQGIDHKYHDKIFDMFSQINQSENDNSTGIGLAIVKKIISENDGFITVDSKKGEGTEIKFTWKITTPKN